MNISDEAREAADDLTHLAMNWSSGDQTVQDSVQQIIQLAVDKATEKLRTELEDRDRLAEFNEQSYQELKTENTTLKKLREELNRERDIPRDKDIPQMKTNIEFLISENRQLQAENRKLTEGLSKLRDALMVEYDARTSVVAENAKLKEDYASKPS